MRTVCVLLGSGLLVMLGAGGAEGQAIVSATAGVLQFFQGAVTIDNHTIERKAASFPAIKDGSTLRTQKGRAEILLSPGFYLRLDENSAIHMISGSLTDTRVEMLSGSAIADSTDAKQNSPVTITYKGGIAMHFPEPGVYRIDGDTGVLQAYSGKAEVESPGNKPKEVDDAHLFFFDVAVVTDKVTGGTEDEFYDWARDRNEAISAQNQLAAQNNGDPGDGDGYAGLGAAGAGPGLPPIPYATPSPNYGNQAPYGSGGYFSGLLNPYYGFGASPFLGYGAFPLILVVNPSNGRYLWPRRTLPAFSGVGARPGYNTGLFPRLPARPVTMPARGLGVTGSAASRPAGISAPRAAPMGGVHAVGHR